MSADHYLAGPCEGMSIHREGLTVSVRDISHREPQREYSFDNEDDARAAVWIIRDTLYRNYEGPRT